MAKQGSCVCIYIYILCIQCSVVDLAMPTQRRRLHVYFPIAPAVLQYIIYIYTCECHVHVRVCNVCPLCTRELSTTIADFNNYKISGEPEQLARRGANASRVSMSRVAACVVNYGGQGIDTNRDHHD